MSDLLTKIKHSEKKKKKKTSVSQTDLQKLGLTGITLRPYQLDGVQWLSECQRNQQGCILGDEMGLGKTCQTISLLVFMSGSLGQSGPFLVLSPLSVMENWRNELQSFAPSLTVLCYKGDKERRAELQRETKHFQVLLTTYELCMNDASFLKRWKWKVLVVDEAHRLKNANSLLHRTLTQELYSLLSFIQPAVFSAEETDDFCSKYANVQNQPDQVKAEVAVDLPKKTELLVYHGMSALQKKYYKAFLMKDLDAFGGDQGSRNRLLNILMNLRKCVDHPYLFDGEI
ncbi:hypothetical protein F7725_027197 [Dissostichus mawsoni]|uniref:Helicase ATP-binding domain-containing protein n=1 Tax=Dissostichus mawsoni TaxID=36200 RepID=A0A7J5XD66_DISMA|nr:hypothetical protein F7725_027197 [Dissostichus mawsoni]